MLKIAHVATFDKSNPLHWYVGRSLKHYRAGQPILGNPHRIKGKVDRQQSLQLYRETLWQMIQTFPSVRQWLYELPADAILHIEDHPKPNSAQIIAAAAAWIKTQPRSFIFPAGQPLPRQHKAPRAHWRIYFGKHAGLTLADIDDQEPTYLDWLASQDWLHGSLKDALAEYIQATRPPHVERLPQPDGTVLTFQGWTATSIFGEYDFRELGGKYLTSRRIFLPGMQTTKLFSHGRPTWIVPEWGNGPVEPTIGEYKRVAPGPQEPARDWNPLAQVRKDPDPRPTNLLTVNTRFARSYAQIRQWGELTEAELELATEPHVKIERAMEAWDLVADIALAIDDRRTQELATDKRLPQLNRWIADDYLQPLRPLWERSEQLALWERPNDVETEGLDFDTWQHNYDLLYYAFNEPTPQLR